MRIILRLFMYLAAFGLLINLILHISSCLGIIPSAYSSQIDQVYGYLSLAMMVVFVASVLTLHRERQDYLPQKDFLKSYLRGCPKWLKYLTALLITYYILFAIIAPNSESMRIPGNSAMGMAFYALSLVLLHSYFHFKVRKCPHGHQVSSADKYCEQCGAQVVDFPESDAKEDARSI